VIPPIAATTTATGDRAMVRITRGLVGSGSLGRGPTVPSPYTTSRIRLAALLPWR
jgi:hypothetical protein